MLGTQTGDDGNHRVAPDVGEYFADSYVLTFLLTFIPSQ